VESSGFHGGMIWNPCGKLCIPWWNDVESMWSVMGSIVGVCGSHVVMCGSHGVMCGMEPFHLESTWNVGAG